MRLKSLEFPKFPGVPPTLISFCLYFHSPLDYVRVGSTPTTFTHEHKLKRKHKHTQKSNREKTGRTPGFL